MKQLKLYRMFAALALVVTACTAKEAGQIEESEATTAEIEAAQMQGREAARRFVNREWKDSLELSKHLLEVAAQRSHYTMQKRYKERDAFDSTFISTVRTVRPGLAIEIERQQP